MIVKAAIAVLMLATIISTSVVPDADARRPGYRSGPVGAPTGALHSRRSSGGGAVIGWVLFLVVFGAFWVAGAIAYGDEPRPRRDPPRDWTKTLEEAAKRCEVRRLLAPEYHDPETVNLLCRVKTVEELKRIATEDPGLRRLVLALLVKELPDIEAVREGANAGADPTGRMLDPTHRAARNEGRAMK